MKIQITDQFLLDDAPVVSTGSAEIFTQFAVIDGVPYRLIPLQRCGYRFQLGHEPEPARCPIYIEGSSAPYCEEHAHLHRLRLRRVVIAEARKRAEPDPTEDRAIFKAKMLKQYTAMTSEQFEELFPEEVQTDDE